MILLAFMLITDSGYEQFFDTVSLMPFTNGERDGSGERSVAPVSTVVSPHGKGPSEVMTRVL